ncbi:PREDICTED: probable calcium-binding [Prunus dulcis]|uniref:PREDICTED: probable calcium-binding n=1 Tax=Prunus dulcis TaxID=3755 RepID=A0A5E4F9E1_PRUDU|nr:PREDICTED: probable calcium-binding [Prunus dulcis]
MDSNGSLTRLELAALLRSLGFKLIGDVVLVANRNGTVEFDELVTTILPNMNDEILIN